MVVIPSWLNWRHLAMLASGKKNPPGGEALAGSKAAEATQGGS
jgi:hypothetical protein